MFQKDITQYLQHICTIHIYIPKRHHKILEIDMMYMSIPPKLSCHNLSVTPFKQGQLRACRPQFLSHQEQGRHKISRMGNTKEVYSTELRILHCVPCLIWQNEVCSERWCFTNCTHWRVISLRCNCQSPLDLNESRASFCVSKERSDSTLLRKTNTLFGEIQA